MRSIKRRRFVSSRIVEGGAHGLQRLAVAVLAHERVAQPLPGVEAARVDGNGGARRHLRSRPVAGVQWTCRRTSAGGWTWAAPPGALEIGDRLRELPVAVMAAGRRRAAPASSRSRKPRSSGWRVEEVLRRLHVGGAQGARVGEPADEGVRTGAVRIRHLVRVDLQIGDRRRRGDREAGRRDVDRRSARLSARRGRRLAGSGQVRRRSVRALPQPRADRAASSTSAPRSTTMPRPPRPPRGGGSSSSEGVAGARSAGAARGVRALATMTPQRGQAASVTAVWPQRGQSMGGFMGANGSSAARSRLPIARRP